MADTSFVGRTEHLTRILGPVGGVGRTGTFFDIEGIPGIGKTGLLNQVVKLKEPEAIVIRIDGGDFQAPGRGFGAPATDEADELRQFRILLRSALDSVSDDEQISKVVQYLTIDRQLSQRMKPGYANRAAQVPLGQATVRYDPDAVLDMATNAASLLARNLADQQVRFLLLVDDFHLLARRPLGRWVMEWLAGIKGADVVVAHQQLSDPEDPGMPTRTVQLPLGTLDLADVTAYLASHPGIGPDVAGIVDHVWDFTGGHPEALTLVADLIKESKSPEESVRLIRQLAALQGGRATQLETVVDRILYAIDDEELRDALYTVCVTRHFDGPLIERLLNVDERHAQTLIDRLRHYSFVHETAVEYSFLTISDFVRRIGERHLGTARTQATHIQAADYYHSLIVEKAEEDDTSYESWYRYEQLAFQALERDWLYHLSKLTGSNRQAGRTGVARIFLDAFWWWGYYIRFPFCEQVLADWSGAISSDEEDRAWGNQLRVLYDQYPRGWKKAAPAEQWAEVRLALRYLWDHCRFGEQPGNREMRQIRGILDLFLVDAVRYIDPSDREADTLLDDAAEQFAANDDEWNVAWAEFYRADLLVSREQTELAISLARGSAERHPDLDDHELLADLHRVCADAQWVRGDHGAALDAYARAVAHAYRFQVKALPDEYTEAFQLEMIERSMERLVALHADDRDEGRAVLRSACARIHAFFGPYWRAIGAGPTADVGLDVVRALDEGRHGDVAGVLFPAVSAPTDRFSDSRYSLICGDVTHTMASELAQPPGAPLPPAESPLPAENPPPAES